LLKKQKEYEKKSTTTDSNGDLLLIRPFPFDKLQIEFSFPKLTLIEKNEGKEKKDNKIEQSIVNDAINAKEKEEILKRDNLYSSSNNNFNSNNKNNNLEKNNLINENQTNNFKNYRNIKNPNSKYGSDNNNIEKGPFVPAGSNFE
jgi:hypothetical protein